jgi:hypothetical protein
MRRVMKFQSLLTILANLAEKNFQEIIPGNESWFAYFIESDAMFTFSPAEVTQRSDHQFRAKTLWLHFFSRQMADWFWMPSGKDPNTIRIILLIIYFRFWTKSRPEIPPQNGADSENADGQFNVS